MKRYRPLKQRHDVDFPKLLELEQKINDLEKENSSLRADAFTSSKEKGASDIVSELMANLSSLSTKLEDSAQSTKKTDAMVGNLQVEIHKLQSQNEEQQNTKLKELENMVTLLREENLCLRSEITSKEKESSKAVLALEDDVAELRKQLCNSSMCTQKLDIAVGNLQSELMKMKDNRAKTDNAAESSPSRMEIQKLEECISADCISEVHDDFSYIKVENSSPEADGTKGGTSSDLKESRLKCEKLNFSTEKPYDETQRNSFHHSNHSKATLSDRSEIMSSGEDSNFFSMPKHSKMRNSRSGSKEFALVERREGPESNFRRRTFTPGKEVPSVQVQLMCQEEQLVTMEEELMERARLLSTKEEKLTQVESALDQQSKILSSLVSENKTLQTDLDKERSWRCDLEDESRELRQELEKKGKDLENLRRSLSRIEVEFIEALRRERGRRAEAEAKLSLTPSTANTTREDSTPPEVRDIEQHKDNFGEFGDCWPTQDFFFADNNNNNSNNNYNNNMQSVKENNSDEERKRNSSLSVTHQLNQMKPTRITPVKSPMSDIHLNQPTPGQPSFVEDWEYNSMMEI